MCASRTPSLVFAVLSFCFFAAAFLLSACGASEWEEARADGHSWAHAPVHARQAAAGLVVPAGWADEGPAYGAGLLEELREAVAAYETGQGRGSPWLAALRRVPQREAMLGTLEAATSTGTYATPGLVELLSLAERRMEAAAFGELAVASVLLRSAPAEVRPALCAALVAEVGLPEAELYGPAGSEKPCAPAAAVAPSWCEVRAVLLASCSGCHGAPVNVRPYFRLDTYSGTSPLGAREMASAIRLRAVDVPTMPPPGAAHYPTAAERALLARWAEAGAPLGCALPIPAQELCAGGIDEDADGLLDCADPDCEGVADVAGGTVCQAGQRAEASCSDGGDNERDGLLDCADPDCEGVPDADGGGTVCRAGKRAEATCWDGLNNDGDWVADCADPDCERQACGQGGRPIEGCVCAAGVRAEALCSDGADNDGDGRADAADSDCAGGAP